jgi:hypothetical protein
MLTEISENRELIRIIDDKYMYDELSLNTTTTKSWRMSLGIWLVIYAKKYQFYYYKYVFTNNVP